MSTSDVLADSIAPALARLLAIPVREVYAALWRVGLIEVEGIEDAQEVEKVAKAAA
ncbi:MAG TPA: Rv1535 domain-containing protein [Mycobacterium sp.]|nr:Rv1535 domain-containing protein [Mycobacterium sp.]